MKTTILWTLVLFAPLMWTTSVHAIFGIPDLAALAQRVTMIAKQGIQIANSVTQINKITEQFDKLVAGSHGLYPGAADCIRRWAAEAPIAVASGALRAEIDAVLGRTGLRRYFTTIVAAGETPRSKPAPDPYLRAVELLRPYSAAAGLDPQGCFVAVEDSPWGIESALAAGLRCIGVAQTYPADRLRAAHAVVATIGALDVDTVHGVCGGRPAASNRNHAGPGDGA